MNRRNRVQQAQETVEILNRGFYECAQGSRVDISRTLQSSVRSTRAVRPAEWAALIASARSRQTGNGLGRIEVTSETTLAALRRLVVAEKHVGVAALNFASAKNPGGGFLGGSQAQEESLARASGLYATLVDQTDYYQINRNCETLLYTDHAIVSPFVPIFRNDDGDLLEHPHHATIITMPAVNVGAMTPACSDISRVAEVMEHRMNCVFAVAVSTGMRNLVLGAWGCGVFRNDPDLIARLFARRLTSPDSWRHFFDRIIFAVLDTTPDTRNRLPFERHLAGLDD
jgi:uncharacterized protein (TIGR02452 family)